MRALVTGGNRYIGLHLLHELVERGHEVTVVNSHEAEMPGGGPADPLRPARARCPPRRPRPHRDEFDIVYDNTAYDVADLEPMVELFAGRVAALRVHELVGGLPTQLRAADAGVVPHPRRR